MYCEEYFDGILQNLTTHTDTPDSKEQQHLPGNVTYDSQKKWKFRKGNSLNIW